MVKYEYYKDITDSNIEKEDIVRDIYNFKQARDYRAKTLKLDVEVQKV